MRDRLLASMTVLRCSPRCLDDRIEHQDSPRTRCRPGWLGSGRSRLSGRASGCRLAACSRARLPLHLRARRDHGIAAQSSASSQAGPARIPSSRSEAIRCASPSRVVGRRARSRPRRSHACRQRTRSRCAWADRSTCSTSTTRPCRPSAAPPEVGRIQLHPAAKPSCRTQRRPPEPLTRHTSAN